IAIGAWLITIIIVAGFVGVDDRLPLAIKADGLSAIGVCDQTGLLSACAGENCEQKKTDKKRPHLVVAPNDFGFPLAKGLAGEVAAQVGHALHRPWRKDEEHERARAGHEDSQRGQKLSFRPN